MNTMSSKVLIPIFFLACAGVSFQATEGSVFVHPYYRFHSEFWPDLDTFEQDFFSDPFFRTFRDPFDWDALRDDIFDFPTLRKPAIGNQRNCLSKPTPRKYLVKPSGELKLSIDVKGFAPKELTLVTKGNDVIIRGEKKDCDSTSCYTRTLCWRKTLPQDVKMNTVRAKLTKDNIAEITAEKKKEIEAEANTKIERETQEKLTPQKSAKREQTKPSRDLPMKNQNPMKEYIPKPKPVDEAEEETTLEVVKDDD